MKSLTIAEAARELPKLINAAREADEEIEIVDGGEVVATLVSAAKGRTALEIFADIEGTLDEETGAELQRLHDEMRRSSWGRLSELRNPWAGS